VRDGHFRAEPCLKWFKIVGTLHFMETTKAFDKLLEVACIKLGFCEGDWDRLPQSGSITSEDFARWLLESERAQVSGTSWGNFYDVLKALFVQEMGCESFDAIEIREELWLGLQVIKKHAGVLQALADSPVDHSKAKTKSMQ
jgi:hypothetical protein